MKFCNLFAAAACVGLVGGPIATAQSNDTLVKRLTLDDMKALITERSDTVERTGENNGKPYVAAKTETGFTYFMLGNACKPETGCQGVEMLSVFARSPNVSLDELNTINTSFAAVSVSLRNDQFLTSRYLIFDEGMTRGNIKVNLDVFLQVAGKVSLRLKEAEAS